MPRVDITQFKGLMPKLANDKLPANMAQTLLDGNTESGAILPYKNAVSETALDEISYKTLFEYIYSNTSDFVYYDGIVFAARSHVAEDTHERMYFCGETGLEAKGTLTLDTQPTATDDMTIDTTTYTFVAYGTSSAQDEIDLGLELGETQRNILQAMRGTDTYNIEHATVQPEEWIGNELKLAAVSHGTAGNSIVTTETFTAGTNVFDAGTLGTTQAGEEDGQYKAFANDLDSSPWDFMTDYYFPGYTAPAGPTITAQTAGATYLAYYYTYVSRYGEEGPGSDITEITNQTVDARVHVDDIAAVPADHGLSDGTVRIYRSATDGQGGSEFLLACEADYFAEATVYVAGEYTIYDTDLYECTVGGTGTWAGGTHTFVQGEAVSVATLGLSTTGDTYLWEGAPDDLTNLRSHPGGFFVASKNNELHFSEPFYHHAWPEDYKIYLDAQIIGIGIFSQTIVVCTDANIYTYSGPHPDSLYKQRLAFQPCLSQRAVTEIDDGVIFPSSEGFQIVSAEGVRNATAETFKPDDLLAYNLDTMHGVWYNKSYYGFHTSSTKRGFIRLDMTNDTLTEGVAYHYAAYVTLSDGLFRTIFPSNIVAPEVLYIAKWDFDDESFKNYYYKSPRFIYNQPVNFKVALLQLDYDFYNKVVSDVSLGSSIEELNQTEWDIATALNPQGVTGACVNDWMPNERSVNGDKLYPRTGSSK